jgi:hypothetical protein
MLGELEAVVLSRDTLASGDNCVMSFAPLLPWRLSASARIFELETQRPYTLCTSTEPLIDLDLSILRLRRSFIRKTTSTHKAIQLNTHADSHSSFPSIGKIGL